jgi:protein regulator of cytokinesis 1
MDTSKMDTSYLSQQVNNIINQLHGLFDEIGVPEHDRENREAEVSAQESRPLVSSVLLVLEVLTLFPSSLRHSPTP